MTTTWTNKTKNTGEIAELWSSAYIPWEVTEQPWLNEDVVAEGAWTNLNKN